MQTELKKLQAAKREHAKLLRNQTHYETQLRTLRNDLASLKQLKVLYLELYYCNIVERFWWDSSLILTTNWFSSVL